MDFWATPKIIGGHFENDHQNHFCNRNSSRDIQNYKIYRKTYIQNPEDHGGGGCRHTLSIYPTIPHNLLQQIMPFAHQNGFNVIMSLLRKLFTIATEDFAVWLDILIPSHPQYLFCYSYSGFQHKVNNFKSHNLPHNYLKTPWQYILKRGTILGVWEWKSGKTGPIFNCL